jgi:hypothetical protein
VQIEQRWAKLLKNNGSEALGDNFFLQKVMPIKKSVKQWLFLKKLR